jgi:hypothetical protein
MRATPKLQSQHLDSALVARQLATPSLGMIAQLVAIIDATRITRQSR